MISVTIDTKQVNSMLVKLTENLSQSSFGRWIKSDVDPIVSQNTQDNFKSQGGRAKGGWKALEQSTIDRKNSSTILVDKDNLRKEVISAKAQVSGYEATWGDNLDVVYKSHQGGFNHKQAKKFIKARPMLTWATGDETKLKNSLEQHIMKI